MTRARRPVFDAVVFDLDGVVTDTATLHATAWKETFDAFLSKHHPEDPPFDKHDDYLRYVDGLPRLDGIRRFLSSRALTLPPGDPGEPPGLDSIVGLAAHKDASFAAALARDGAPIFSGTVRLVQRLRDAGVRVGVASSSKNCQRVLDRVGLGDLFEARVCGLESARLGLNGKPAPDIFIECAQRLGATPASSIVVEDAISGVQAGRSGNFALVVGVDRHGNSAALRKHGAHVVVHDLDLDLDILETAMNDATSTKDIAAAKGGPYT